jgi:protocatechuate 3,4-dioxygenase beta subunit
MGSTVASDRLQGSLELLTAALRQLIDERKVTSDEWMQVLAFLTEVGRTDEFILLSDVLGLSVFLDERTHPAGSHATPSNVQGPFYLPDAPILDPPYRLAGDDEPGEPLVFQGHVSDAETGRPVPGAMLDVWQADDDALYDVQRGTGEPRLRGRFPADHVGDYRLRTIVPPPYEIRKDGPVGRLLGALGRHAWRPAHLHLKVEHTGYEPLTTMVYLEGDPWLDSDSIGSVKPSLVVPLEQRSADEFVDRPHARCTFDIALSPTIEES